MEERGVFKINGKNPISGKIKTQGNKNEAIPLLAASLLTDEEVILQNVPPIEDVRQMQQILQYLGVDLQVEDGELAQKVCIQAAGKLNREVPAQLCERLRGAVTLAGPLLARNGELFLPRVGGDRIGRRRLDTHILALRALGADIKIFSDGIEIKAASLKGADILLDEASVTATENTLCAAVLAKNRTIIRNAASEPHVQGLCRLLISMGAKIEGVGSNVLYIEGVERLRGITHQIGPDYLEAGSLISLAAVSGGELLIEGIRWEDIRMIQMVFSRLGIEVRAEKEGLLVPKNQSLKIVSDIGGAVPRIDDAPWPGFPADMTSVALVTATQCKGTVLIHEKMFESRLFFTDHLISMGAQIVLCDPHRAMVMGPSPLKGSILASPDIRAGMALLIAALCAEGESHIHNIVQIDRGFTKIDKRLSAVGARIDRQNL